MKTFTYLGSTLAEDGELDAEVTHRGAERVEEREESVWSVVRQENECEDQGEGTQNSGKTSTDVRAETWALKKAQEKKLEVA